MSYEPRAAASFPCCMPFVREEERERRLGCGRARGKGYGSMKAQDHTRFRLRLDHGGEMLHALEASLWLSLRKSKMSSLTPRRPYVAMSAAICSVVPEKGPTFESSLTLCGQRDIVEWGFIGNRQRFWIASSRLGQAFEVTERDFQLMRPQRHRRIGTDRVPAIAIARGPS